MDNALEAALRAGQSVFFTNPGRAPLVTVAGSLAVTRADIEVAGDRLERFAPLLAELFPELAPAGGSVESALVPVPVLERRLHAAGLPAGDRVFLKADHALPVVGSVKARGGLHAVLAVAEALALADGLLSGPRDEYRRLGEPAARDFFAGHTLSVGSTGNLGLSIGVFGRGLGFGVTVHMSAEARAWKKEKLRRVGATVVEHPGDYAAACAVAREEAARSPRRHFIDDENSLDLLLGYAVAGLRLPDQLAACRIAVSPEHPLCLHLPCGVGGAPGGIALGARLVLGDAAQAYFVEPTQAPALLLGLATGRHGGVSAAVYGLTGRTVADGLAVSRPSELVCRLMASVLDGAHTVSDAALLGHVAEAWNDEALRLEPSAAAALAGPLAVRRANLPALAGRAATHICWATGGSLLPDAEFAALLARAGTRP
ncbi:D-serine ammonia-lyase [Desulfovibrio sp. TomC]|uniref:D-serine ammonia-lyase n=1 Tax=Desulfovibrio sp. TomC TaxID=1562888 RepID=UPI000575BAE2|nr:D-serine ammonia-lyase [Desulfovibrio sp. TomC]KHK00727.1 D-serine dehydratase [Desulfovibrio sp. TomC]